MKPKNNLFKLVFSGFFLALALVLPFLTGQNKELGNVFCLMHIPVLLCGFFCGPWYGLAVGAIAPLLRFLLCGAPPMPTALAMSFELMTYGLVSGLLYRLLPKKKAYIYVALIAAMLAGRLVGGCAMTVLMGLGKVAYGFEIFLTNNFIKALPGIAIQIVLIPILVMAICRAFPKLNEQE